MKVNMRSFQMFIRQIRGDKMLYMLCFLPLLIAAVFRFGIPFLEARLCAAFGAATILADYYLLFDLFLAVFTPYFLVFISAMVMLSEIDENIAAYLAVTPIRRRGYLVSRLLYPALLSVAVSAALLFFCSLTPWTVWNILLACLLSAVLCIPVAMLIVSFSHNRVEGMALAKLAGLLLFGLPVPFFLQNGYQYLFAWLPSFWLAKIFTDRNGWFILPAVSVSMIWLWAQYRRFERKLL
ncbi:MAG: ABC transporter permease [Bacillota bacterium]